MTLADWLRGTRRNVARDGLDGVRESAYELWLGLLRRVDARGDRGTCVFDREWDALVVLDGCRVDAMAEVADEYGFLPEPGVHRSPGSTSYEWMARTFADEYAAEMARTAHVSANPFTDEYCEPGRFAVLAEVWRDAWDDDVGVVPARAVTDRAVRVARERADEFDRLLIHYMQPHFPSVPEPLGYGSDLASWRDGEEMAWQGLRRGDLDRETVWRAYLANLRYVLDDVELLLHNLDADRVVVSADHGNACGEFGVYGHPNVPLGVLREVPWYGASATDERTHEPSTETETTSETPVEDRLRALGYREES